MVKAEDRVKKYIKALEKNHVFDSWHINLISDVYETVKPEVAEDLYMDIVSVCVTFILAEKSATYEKMVDEVRKTLGLNRHDDKEVGLKEIVDPYASKNEKDDGVKSSKKLVSKYGMYGGEEDEMRKALEETIDTLVDNSNNLNNPVDVSNAIFLDVVIRGLTREQASKKYRMPLTTISEILEERKEAVVDILVVNYGVVVKDVETREPYKSLAKQMTDPKNTNK